MIIKNRKNVIIHDYLESFGGGERVIKFLCNKIKSYFIYGFKNKKFTQNLNKKKFSYQLYNSNIPKFIKKIYLIKKFQKLTISSSVLNCFITGNYSIFTNFEHAKNSIYYCHSLPRLIFRYNSFYKKRFFLKFIINIFKKSFIKSYTRQLNKFNTIVANSQFTKNQLERYTNKDINVIFPPIDTHKARWISQENFFVSNSRHEDFKNIDKIIFAFKRARKFKLIITSQGSKTNYLKKIAKDCDNIVFTGLISDKEYYNLLGRCLALINISNYEDFGMSIVEGLACGKASFIYPEGGIIEYAKNNFNSFFVNKNDEHDLFNKINNININKLKKIKKNCIQTSLKFSDKVFLKRINELLI